MEGKRSCFDGEKVFSFRPSTDFIALVSMASRWLTDWTVQGIQVFMARRRGGTKSVVWNAPGSEECGTLSFSK